MKKIIVGVAAITMACAVNAGTFLWGAAGGVVKADGETPMDTGTAFLFLGTVTATEQAFVIAGTTEILHEGFNADQGIYGNLDESSFSSSDLVTDNSAGQAFSIVVVDKDVSTLSGYEGNYVILTGVSERGEIPGATTTYYPGFYNYDLVGGPEGMAWSTMQAAPEPTSGLLLLLGVAGLALRRGRRS